MNDQTILDELTLLRSMEKFAKSYYDLSGTPLPFEQFLYIQRNGISLSSFSNSLSPSMLLEATRAREAFVDRLKPFHGILPANDFLMEDHNIEIEQLERYISIPEHTHDFPEITCVLSGTCIHIVNGRKHQQDAGTLSFITSYTSHELIPVNDCICMTIKVRSEYFQKLKIPNLPYYSTSICFHLNEDDFFTNIILAIYEQQKKDLAYSNDIIENLLVSLLTYCMQRYRDTIEILGVGYTDDLLDLEIINYIYENYQTVTLHSMAQNFHVSDSYLSNHLKKVCGKTYLSIIREFRLQKAANLLQQTDWKLNQICESIGYQDVPQFIQNFKAAYGMTPGKYRKNISPASNPG